MVDVEVGMEKQYFAVDTEMTVALAGIGINVTDHTLYLTVTPRGGVRIIPINSRHRQRLCAHQGDRPARRG